jgi:hypothetical protein
MMDEPYRTRSLPLGMSLCIMSQKACYKQSLYDYTVCKQCKPILEESPVFQYPDNLGEFSEDIVEFDKKMNCWVGWGLSRGRCYV